MRNYRFLTVITVPLIALSLAACSVEEDPWASPNPSPTESEYVPLDSEVPALEEEKSTEENSAPEKETVAVEEVENDSAPTGDEQTAEGAAAFVNAFYAELASESRLTSFESKIAEKNPNWQNSAPGDEESEALTVEVLEEVYGDLVAKIDTEGADEATMSNLYATLYMSNNMHVLQADVLPAVELNASNVTVDDATATFSMADAYGDADMEIATSGDSVLRYKNGSWFFTVESMLM